MELILLTGRPVLVHAASGISDMQSWGDGFPFPSNSTLLQTRHIMLRTIYRLLLSLSATSWFILVFLVKYLFELDIVYYCVTIAGCLIASIVITMIGLKLSKKLDCDDLNDYSELELVDNEGLSIYLAYFFVALSVDNLVIMGIVYAIIFAFTFITQATYYNPLFIIFNYHFYKGVTVNGVRHNLIIKGDIINNTKTMPKRARRINNTTFISEKED